MLMPPCSAFGCFAGCSDTRRTAVIASLCSALWSPTHLDMSPIFLSTSARISTFISTSMSRSN